MSAATTVLRAVWADDALLDSLGGRDPQMSTDLLTVELLAWRAQVDRPAVGELVSVGRAVRIIRRNRRRIAIRRIVDRLSGGVR